MKIVDLICSPGRTGFYFDDQRAIKGGAGHDGMFYTGGPVTPGFRSVRQAGESISVMLVLEDGQAVGLGTHETLLKTCPVYREIHATQQEQEVGA